MPHPSKHAAPRNIDELADELAAQGIDPNYVSYPCTIDDHDDCGGKVQRVADGRWFRCRCPNCQGRGSHSASRKK